MRARFNPKNSLKSAMNLLISNKPQTGTNLPKSSQMWPMLLYQTSRLKTSMATLWSASRFSRDMIKRVWSIQFMVSIIKKLTAPSGFQSPKPTIWRPGSSTTFWTGTLHKVQFNHLMTVLSFLLTKEIMPQVVSLEWDTTSPWAIYLRVFTLINSISQEPWLHQLKAHQASNSWTLTMATSTTLPLEWDSTFSREQTLMNKPWESSSTSKNGMSSINQVCKT